MTTTCAYRQHRTGAASRLSLVRCGVVLGALLSGPALSHVTMVPNEGTVGTSLQATFTVPHGCSGSATVAIRVKIPDGVTQVKPQFKAGWNVTIKRRKLASVMKGEGGRLISETVDEIEWRGGPLADELYDEFGVKLRLPEGSAGRTLFFPVVQECASGSERWIDVPAGGAPSEELRRPAPAMVMRQRGR